MTASQIVVHMKTEATRCLTSDGPRLKRKKKTLVVYVFLLPPMLLAIKQRQRLLLGFCTAGLLAFKCSWVKRLTALPQHQSYPHLQTPPSPTAKDRAHQSGGKSYAVQSAFPTTALKKEKKRKTLLLLYSSVCWHEFFSGIDHWQWVLTAEWQSNIKREGKECKY